MEIPGRVKLSGDHQHGIMIPKNTSFSLDVNEDFYVCDDPKYPVKFDKIFVVSNTWLFTPIPIRY